MERPRATPDALAEARNRSAVAELFSNLYADLRSVAQRELARCGRRAPLEVGSLLHEAFLAIGRTDQLDFPDRARFMAYAGCVMRRLIIDHLRRRGAQKRGGNMELTTLRPDEIAAGLGGALDDRQLEALEKALEQLAEIDPALVEIVDLKFFCGISIKEIAAARDVSERTLQRHWDKARLILHHSLQAAALD